MLPFLQAGKYFMGGWGPHGSARLKMAPLCNCPWMEYCSGRQSLKLIQLIEGDCRKRYLLPRQLEDDDYRYLVKQTAKWNTQLSILSSLTPSRWKIDQGSCGLTCLGMYHSIAHHGRLQIPTTGWHGLVIHHKRKLWPIKPKGPSIKYIMPEGSKKAWQFVTG